MDSWASSEHGSWFPVREVAKGRKQKLLVPVIPGLGSPRTLLLPHSPGRSHGASLDAKEGEINSPSHWGTTNAHRKWREELMAAVFGGCTLL